MRKVILLGDYNESFLTHRELAAALRLLPPEIAAQWVASDSPQAAKTHQADGLWVIPGSPYRDDEAVYRAIRRARESGQPFLGTCGGFQYAVVEFARNVAEISMAGHAETAKEGETAVVQRLACSLVGKERLVRAVPGTRLYAACGPDEFVGFHWCNFGLADEFVSQLEQHGLKISGYASDAGAEAIEIPDHPFFWRPCFSRKWVHHGASHCIRCWGPLSRRFYTLNWQTTPEGKTLIPARLSPGIPKKVAFFRRGNLAKWGSPASLSCLVS